MDDRRLDQLAAALAGNAKSRRAMVQAGGVSIMAAAFARFALPSAAVESRRKKKRKCRGKKRKCGQRCIPATHCCRDSECGPGGTCQGGTCLCPSGSKPCQGRCIPEADCCSAADCASGEICSSGVCVTGQGTCPSQADSCAQGFIKCASDPNGICACFQSMGGQTRCGSNEPVAGFDNCETDDDCAEQFPDVPGVFCTKIGNSCPYARFCQAPCPE